MTKKIEARVLNQVQDKSIDYYISLGNVISLPKSNDVFLPSHAGIFFWETIYKNFSYFFNDYTSVLDLGCGSGFISIALALSGCKKVTGSDINHSHVTYAKEQFCQHISNHSTSKFICSDLFNNLGNDMYDFIAFNCPGWGTPDNSHIEQFKLYSGQQYYSMFEGDATARRSIQDGFDRLNEEGVFVIGLNSMGDIPSVIGHAKELRSKNITMRSLGKIEFPLMLYNRQWKDKRDDLIEQFFHWRENGKSFFRVKDNEIFWTYEVIALVNTKK